MRDERTLESRVRSLDIDANRSARKWTTCELVGRVVWAAVIPLFWCSPRVLWSWRRFILRCFGASVSAQVHILPSVRISIPWNLTIGEQSSVGFDTLIYNLGRVYVGRRVTISQRAHLCGGTHDFCDPTMPLVKSPITIEDDAWVCADAFVGPGVTIGAGAVVGARAVVTKDVPPWAIVAGNPAREIGKREMVCSESASHDLERQR